MAGILLNMAEQLFALPADTPVMDATALAVLLANRAALYDKDREEHYNLISALHKSLRGSDAGCGAVLVRPHADGRRGPALHRPPPGAFRRGGYRHGRSAGAAAGVGGVGDV